MSPGVSTLRRPNLLGLRLGELSALLGSRTRALEVVRWLHGPFCDGEGGAPAIRAERWRELQARFELAEPALVERRTAEDGTTKYLLQLGDVRVETVRIPVPGRSTLCLSSQAGCSRRCAFCATATLGFGRNLSAGEMVAQFRVAAREAGPGSPVRNVVFMGQGEPMDNLDEVLRAVDVLLQAPAPQLSAGRVTVSTSGVLPGMKRFLAESRASLALSLNATTDAQRERLMPQTRQWPIGELLGLLEEDGRKNPGRVHFIEYVLFAGINDTREDASRLVALLGGIAARVNLIPHNPFPGSPFEPPGHERLMDFQRWVSAGGLRCIVRWPRGAAVDAACGQLARA